MCKIGESEWDSGLPIIEKNFFSKDYHREIFFYVYSNSSKKVLAQGGGYKYKKNNKVLNGFGFSCNIDNWVELI